MDRIAPQWIVDNVDKTASFYSEKLGFKIDFMGDGPLFAIISRGNVTLMMRQLSTPSLKRPNAVPFLKSGWHTEGVDAWDAYIWVDNVEELYGQLTKNGVEITKKLTITEYNNKDFEIMDINGYRICFGESLD
ncbi:VOC family protein [Allomuricauda sp. d1]|uniref:VOC family protein n=1 Tax=Allomuricauda sp. d1 TaxID=3136725 RepID=UPI0031E30B32